MRKFFGVVLLVASAALPSVGCGEAGSITFNGDSGGDSESGGTTNNDTSSAPTTTTSSTTTYTPTTTWSTTTSGTTPPTGCTGIAPDDPCGTCSEGACCAEIQDCNQYDGCVDCVYNGGDCSDPTFGQSAQALFECLRSSCRPECGPPACNPVTNDGCDAAAGEACDLGLWGYECYPDGNTQALCEPCGGGDGYCKGGLTCDGTCAKLCCDDSDCGTGSCNKNVTGDPTVGLCYDDNYQPACDAPAVSPSGGSCVTP